MNKKIMSLLTAVIVFILPFMVQTVHAQEKETENKNTIAVENAINEYFSKRQAFLQGKCDEREFEEIVNTGVLEDEKLHLSLLTKRFLADSVRITSLKAWDDEAYVVVEETRDGDVILHKITLAKTNQENWIVISDGYFDTYDSFKSASYVCEEKAAELLKCFKEEQEHIIVRENGSTRGMMSNNSEQLRNLLVDKADSQVGYYEKYINASLENFTAYKGGGGQGFTKYGEWAIQNSCKWCAAFISWCANDVQISTSIIPHYIWVAYKEGNPDSIYNFYSFFNNAGRFHAKGSYTPKKGDIFIMLNNGYRHVGIVVSVSGNNMVAIHGNTPDSDGYYCVVYEVIPLTDTKLTGYGSPDYCMGNNHSYGSYSHDDSTHWHVCTVCGYNAQGIHEWVSMGSYYRCRVCGRTATNVSGPIYNGTVPVDR